MAHKPIIGLAGGIGSGKTHVARIFESLGCDVFYADDAVTEIYREPAIQQQLRRWWPGKAINAAGEIDRNWIAQRIFSHESDRRRLESLIHPRVQEIRRQQMARGADNPSILAFVWDIPLLFETGLHQRCDKVVFVESTHQQRLQRVAGTRGWDAEELARRENLQLPLDKKKKISDYIIINSGEAPALRQRVEEVLNRILAAPQTSGNAGR